MKHLIILGDGMADHPVERLGGKTLLQYASTPAMDQLAREGRCGMLTTIPEGFQPGSEVANTAILGYDLSQVYEGRGPLEAASIGYEMEPDDLALRCNLITLEDGKILNHHGGHLGTEDGHVLIHQLQEELGSEVVKFLPGIQYRHLLIIKGGSKYIECTPPHDHPGEPWRERLVKPIEGMEDFHEDQRMTPRETADLLNYLIERSHTILENYPLNLSRKAHGKPMANSIWPWGGGYRPHMLTLEDQYPQVKSGTVISAVDLIRGIGHYAGLDIIKVPGATGLYNTNYDGKCRAAIEALKKTDFVFLHIEASDEAGHDGDLDLKLRTIESLDQHIVEPILWEVARWDEPVCVALLPDHPTPVELRTHVAEPVPFAFWHKGMEPDSVQTFDEEACAKGAYGHLYLSQFMHEFMKY
ncbi:MAG: cofactor-independent phosphoglycerate mutase [Bacteroidales bacterium]|nr:cofactor-independent phosphoglycerate mutase [Bacteroidales bacterium]